MIWGLWLQSCERLCFCCLKLLGMNTPYIMQDGRVSWVPRRPSVGTPRVLDLCKWTLLPYCWSPNPWLYPQLPVFSGVPQSLLFFHRSTLWILPPLLGQATIIWLYGHLQGTAPPGPSLPRVHGLGCVPAVETWLPSFWAGRFWINELLYAILPCGRILRASTWWDCCDSCTVTMWQVLRTVHGIWSALRECQPQSLGVSKIYSLHSSQHHPLKTWIWSWTSAQLLVVVSHYIWNKIPSRFQNLK